MSTTEQRAEAARLFCPFLNTKQTAYHLGIQPETLRKMRARGKGPRCRRHGRAFRYHIDDIEAWSNSTTWVAADA